MSDEQLAAEPAAEEVVVAEQPEQPVEAEAKPEPEAGGEDAAADEKTRTQLRREQRKAAEQREREARAEMQRRLAEAEAQLARVRDAGQKVKDSLKIDPDDAFADLKTANADALVKMREAEALGQIESLKAAAQQAEETRLRSLQMGFIEEIPRVKERYPDFEAVVQQAAKETSPQLSWMIMESDQAHDLAYHIGKNPALARTLSAMSPVEAARHLGKIEATLAAPKPATRAPEPITPNKGSAPPAKDPAKMTAAEYSAWREAGGTF